MSNNPSFPRISNKSVIRFRSLKKRKKVRRKIKDTIQEKRHAQNKSILMSIVFLVFLFVILAYLKTYP